MQLNQETLRFIFGIKLRNLRLERGLSLKELAKASGLSPSYINEIEKSKKYPKSDKILLLANSLGVSYDQLTSVQLTSEMRSIAKILQNQLLSDIPFDVFGLPAQNIFELVADAPNEFGSLIGALLELARQYDIQVEDFFYSSLRSHIDRHRNYFESLEQSALEFRSSHGFLNEFSDPESHCEHWFQCLSEEFGETIQMKDFASIDSQLSKVFFVRDTKKGLILNKNLSHRELNFLLAREVGFRVLNLKERPSTSLLSSVESFEHVFNNFQASYFASACLIAEDDLKAQLVSFLASSQFSAEAFQRLVMRYPSTFESVFHRISQLLPRHFGIEQLFLLRMNYDSASENYELKRELHLSQLHSPHGVRSDEHYCRRWVSTSLAKKLSHDQKSVIADAQISQFFQTDNRYLCLALSYPADLSESQKTCLTLGLSLNQPNAEKIGFAKDIAVEHKTVSSTCEQCHIDDCSDRAAPVRERPRAIDDQQLTEAIQKLIQ